MLDIEYIRTNRDTVAQAITDKLMKLDLDRLLTLDVERRELITKRDALLAERNQLAIEQAKERGPALKAELAEIEPRFADVEAEFNLLMLQVPQIPAADAPRGDESQYVEIKKVGEPAKFDFEPKDHIALGKILDLIDIDRGAAVSGYRGYYLKNEAALMHHGLMQLGLQIMRKNGFTVMVPPTIVRDRALVGSGHFPFGRAEVYQIANPSRLADGAQEKEAQNLVGTAEP